MKTKEKKKRKVKKVQYYAPSYDLKLQPEWKHWENSTKRLFMFIPKCWSCLNRNKNVEWGAAEGTSASMGFDGSVPDKKVPLTPVCSLGCGERAYHGYMEFYQTCDVESYDGQFQFSDSDNVWVADDSNLPKRCNKCDNRGLCVSHYKHCPLKHGMLATKRKPVKRTRIHPTGWYWELDTKSKMKIENVRNAYESAGLEAERIKQVSGQYACRWYIDERIIGQKLKYPMLLNEQKVLLLVDAMSKYTGREHYLRLEILAKNLDIIRIKQGKDDREGYPLDVINPKLKAQVLAEMRILWKGGHVDKHSDDLAIDGGLWITPAGSAARVTSDVEQLDKTGITPDFVGSIDPALVTALPDWVFGGKMPDPQEWMEEKEDLVEDLQVLHKLPPRTIYSI